MAQESPSSQTSSHEASPSHAPQGKGRNNRRMRNFLLAPRYQVKMGIYAVLLGGAFATGASFLAFKKLGRLYNVILELTDAREEVSQILRQYVYSTGQQVAILLGIYIVANVLLSVIITHKMVGPTIAFRRHIRALIDGNLMWRTRLRDGDAFPEIAHDLNELSATLSTNQQQTPARGEAVG